MVVVRYVACAAAAVAVSFALFFTMQALISQGRASGEDGPSGPRIDFVRLERSEDAETKRRALPKRVAPPPPPPPPPIARAEIEKPTLEVGAFAPSFAADMDIDRGPAVVAPPMTDQAVPLVRVQPLYPPAARERRISGWVELEFTIGPLGTVLNPTVTASEPGSIFDRAALKAVAKWRYRPASEGSAEPAARQKVRITFEVPD